LDNLVRIVDINHAWPLPPRARRAVLPPAVIIVVIISGASLLGHGIATLGVAATGLLAAAAGDLERAALRHWRRCA
jgi:hypothetical protein